MSARRCRTVLTIVIGSFVVRTSSAKGGYATAVAQLYVVGTGSRSSPNSRAFPATPTIRDAFLPSTVRISNPTGERPAKYRDANA